MTVANLCIIEDNGRVLMKLATRGVMKGKWNFPGGKIDEGETQEESTAREVLEETGLTVRDLAKVGDLEFYDNKEVFFSVEVYRAGSFSGALRETEEGILRWFDTSSLPFDRMSSADRFWVPHVMEGRSVKGEFYFEDKDVDRLTDHRVTVQPDS